MPNRAAVSEFFRKAEEVFWSRNSKYGTKGMTVTKAASLASTKLDRIMNGGELTDSTIDLANYALIASLIASGDWSDDEAGEEDLSSCLQFKIDPEAEEFGLPSPKKHLDNGYDLTTTEDIEIRPAYQCGEPFHVKTGLSMKTPDGFWAEIRPRSSAAKRGLVVIPCVLDEGYSGPLFAQVFNITNVPIIIKRGERVAQVLVHRSETPKSIRVAEMPVTERGATGFGSSGV